MIRRADSSTLQRAGLRHFATRAKWMKRYRKNIRLVRASEHPHANGPCKQIFRRLGLPVAIVGALSDIQCVAGGVHLYFLQGRRW